MLPLLNAGEARNWARDNDTILQEIMIISLAINNATALSELSTTVRHDTIIDINGSTVTGSIMTNQDAIGLSYYHTWSGSTVDAKLSEQMDTILKYFKQYLYAITITSPTSNSIAWKISW